MREMKELQSKLMESKLNLRNKKKLYGKQLEDNNSECYNYNKN